MQQSFVLIILHISICIHSQLHLWILAGAEADKDSGCIPASGASIPHFVRHCHLYVLFRTGAEHLDRYRCAGLTFGEIAASFYSLHSIRQFLESRFQKKSEVFFSPCCIPSAFTETLEHALPLTASRVFLNILQSVEAVSIPVCLQYYGMPAAQSLQTYGVLTGMALPCILFPSAVTNAVSSMLLPTVAGLQEMKGRQQLRSLILKITCSCILLGCFCCGVLLILGKWIGIFLFKSPLAGNFILTLAWICPFLYTNTVLLSMINGLGKTTCSFLFNLFSLCIRITGVFLFIPAAGISGYLNGLLISQIFLFLCCILRLSVYAGKY